MNIKEKGSISTSLILLGFDSDKFLNLGALTNSITEIEELGTSNLTASDNLYLLNSGRVDGEGLLNAATVSNVANGEGLGDAATVLADNGTLKNLNSLSGTLFDLVVNLYGVTNVELGNLSLKLLARKSSEFIHCKTPPVNSGHSYRAL